MSLKLVFSDLDGSLLDHDTYSHAAAAPALQRLDQHHIPLILVSSKTRVEIERLRSDLNNSHPFISENGAAVFVPKALSAEQPADTRDFGEYWAYETVRRRQHWLDILASVGESFEGEYQTFFAAGADGIQIMTGLDESSAKAANQRDYSEPVAWLGTESRKREFVAQLTDAGATVQQGGRFLSVSGACNKGKALNWLKSKYRRWSRETEIEDIAIGDGENDIPMLQAAKTALLIRSPAHEFPSFESTGTILKSQSFGPSGWYEGVMDWLSNQDPDLQGQ